MALGMFNSKNYQSDTVVRGLSLIPLRQAGFLCALGALLGGPIALVSFICFLKQRELNDISIICIPGMFAGGFLCLLGMTVPYIIYLSKELQLIKDCLCEECASNITEKNRINKKIEQDVALDS